MAYSIPLSAISLNSSGQLVFNVPIASGAVSSITGTANEVIASTSSGSVTLSLPQAIATTSTPTFASETLTSTTNQLTLGTTNTTTLSSVVPSASRIYTLPDAGTDANLVLDQGNYTIGGFWTFSNTPVAPGLSITNSNTLIFRDSEVIFKTASIQAPTTLSSSYLLTLPLSQGGMNTLLQNDGSGNLSWISPSSGTVTSVAMTVPSFLSVSGSPVTSSGTLALTLSGVALPVANGGTNSIVSLTNNKVIVSSSGSIVESSIVPTNVFLADGTVPATGAFSLGNNQVHNVTDPTSAQDAATKNYVDNAVNGLDWKQAALLATTTTLPTYIYSSGVITMVATGTVSVDGSVLALGNRILVKNETSTNQPYNGIYNVTTAGAVGVACVLTRSTDYNSVSDIQPGDAVYIQTGTVNATTSWVQTQTITSVGGVGQNIIFVQSAGPGTIVINGTTNQIIASTTGNTTTLSTPQSIATTSSPTFTALTVFGGANGLSSAAGNLSLIAANGVKLTDNGGAGVIVNANAIVPASISTTSIGTSGLPFTNLWLSGGVNAASASFTSALTVANGGTGDSSLTAYAVLTGGTTSTGAIQSVSGVGTSGQVLTSNGASALPTWQTFSGSGTVNSGTSTHLAYYATSTNAVSDAAGNSISGLYTFSALQTFNNGVYITDSGSSSTFPSSGTGLSLIYETSQNSAFITCRTAPSTYEPITFNALSYGFSISNSTDVVFISSSGITMNAGTIAMGSNKITGLANGTASTDAAAFGQIGGTKGTNADGYIKGTIIQLGSEAPNATVYTSSGATFTAAPNLNMTITPLSSTSVLRIRLRISLHVTTTLGTTCDADIRIVRDPSGANTTVQTFNEMLASGGTGAAQSDTWICTTVFAQDSPGTTSATTYGVAIRNSGGGTSTINDQTFSGADSSLCIDEIAQ